MRLRTLLSALLCSASPSVAASDGMVSHLDLPYTEPSDPARSLDLYQPKKGERFPVLIWIHGGGWRSGDKKGVQHKPAGFTQEGFLFVSLNYRLQPGVTMEEQVEDVARAIRWVRDHAADYGGDPDRLFVLGHSSGAHMAALVAIDPRHLTTVGMSPADLAGCIPIDTAAFDMPLQLESVGPRRRAFYTAVFGTDPEDHRRLSPVHQIVSGVQRPPFLILHVASRADATRQSERLATALEQAGTAVAVVPVRGRNHFSINGRLGEAGDPATAKILRFLRSRT